MKKKLLKKLSLNKETIASLQSEEMKLIKGAYSFDTCGCDTASCSIVVYCCGQNTKEQNIEEGLK